MQKLEEINIVLYIILCVLSLGLFYFVWQYKQMQQCNILLASEEHGLFKWFFLTFITLGIYHFYHEYKMSQDIITIQEKYKMDKVSGNEFPILCLIVSVFGFFLISDFIHQEELNKIIRKIKSSNEYQHLLK
jgi:signal transduction histidine kinase